MRIENVNIHSYFETRDMVTHVTRTSFLFWRVKVSKKVGLLVAKNGFDEFPKGIPQKAKDHPNDKDKKENRELDCISFKHGRPHMARRPRMPQDAFSLVRCGKAPPQGS